MLCESVILNATPHFVVFYNGTEKRPEREILNPEQQKKHKRGNKEECAMYIKKTQYYLLKLISGIGVYFWGFLFWAMIFGIFMDFSMGNDDIIHTDIPSITIGLCFYWLAHLFFRHWVEKLIIYNGIFSNDADGVLPVKVVSRALDFPEKKVISDIEFLCKLHILKNCVLRKEESNTIIILSGNGRNGMGYQQQLRRVICPHCGGENMVRVGFVMPCNFCGGSLAEGGKEHVSE